MMCHCQAFPFKNQRKPDALKKEWLSDNCDWNKTLQTFRITYNNLSLSNFSICCLNLPLWSMRVCVSFHHRSPCYLCTSEFLPWGLQQKSGIPSSESWEQWSQGHQAPSLPWGQLQLKRERHQCKAIYLSNVCIVLWLCLILTNLFLSFDRSWWIWCRSNTSTILSSDAEFILRARP